MIKDSDQILLSCAYEAFEKDFDVDNPDRQITPTIRNAVRRLRIMRAQGKQPTLTIEAMRRISLMGGTDHPDPFV
ncbi:MAG TPA: hypothetical protein VJB96_01080 [Patescibacteria group bacterium]|nr:hypothetical protein [Patescibacteria group bacterium]